MVAYDSTSRLIYWLAREKEKKMSHINSILDMIRNEDFDALSRIAVVNNEMNSGFVDVDEVQKYGIGDETEALNEDRDEIDDAFQVPSSFTNFEGIDMTTVDIWSVSHSVSKNDFTRQLRKDTFKDKEEVIRAIKLHTIRTHKYFEVVETCPTIWKIRCKLHSQSGCKWQVCASKLKRNGYFEITKYTGPHTCLHYKITQDHPNQDACLIAQETKHLIKEQPSISIPALRAEIINKLGCTPSYKKVWVRKEKAIEHVFGNWDDFYIVLPSVANLSLNSWQYVHKCYSIQEYCATWASEFFPLPHEAYWPQSSFVGELLPNSNLKRVKAGHPHSTRIHNGMDIKEGKKNNLCEICKQGGHNRKTCPSRPRSMGVDH